jgi:hypothetical protein
MHAGGKVGLSCERRAKNMRGAWEAALIRRWHGIPPDILIRGGEAPQWAGRSVHLHLHLHVKVPFVISFNFSFAVQQRGLYTINAIIALAFVPLTQTQLKAHTSSLHSTSWKPCSCSMVVVISTGSSYQ